MLADPQISADQSSIAISILIAIIGVGFLWAARWVYWNPRKFARWFRHDSPPSLAIFVVRIFSVVMMFVGSVAIAPIVFGLLPIAKLSIATRRYIVVAFDIALIWFVFRTIKRGRPFTEFAPEPQQRSKYE